MGPPPPGGLLLIGMLERGERMPTLGIIQNLADALATTITSLIEEMEKGG